MPAGSKRSTPPRPVALATVLAWLEKTGTRKVRDGMARYGIPDTHAFGVTVGALKAFAKPIGRDHALAEGLWKSGHYEARMLAAFVGDPSALTAKQMDAWASDFDNWAICDAVCFHLFDRTPLAWPRVHAWAKVRPELKKRAAFALLWGLTVHDKTADDASFSACLPLLERGAEDERLYIKKAVDMALRATGKRNAALRREVLAFAQRLSESELDTQAWIGRSALRELSKSRA
jgi:3-methyladenine DNA glycosylase AlkD